MPWSCVPRSRLRRARIACRVLCMSPPSVKQEWYPCAESRAKASSLCRCLSGIEHAGQVRWKWSYGFRMHVPLALSHWKPIGQSVVNRQSLRAGIFGCTESKDGGWCVGVPNSFTARMHVPDVE
jgi:hypothetical protein